jgi:hypothetical protein
MSLSLSLYLCILSFALCYWSGRRSLVSGLIAVLGVGYAYGIIRANVSETYSHFIFDAGVVGLYAAQLFHRLNPLEAFKVSHLRPWLEFLIAWPLLLFLIPIQDWLIQFVGLRGSIFLLPFVLFGARLRAEDRYRLAGWIAAFNLLAFAFAGAEYFLGLDRFFPRNHVTDLIYISKDLIGHTQYRIPASFPNAHAYGGTMVMSLPLLVGAVIQKHKSNLRLQLLVMGIVAALVGVLMSAARTHFLAAVLLVIVGIFSLRSRLGYAMGWLILLCVIGWFVSGEQRLQRFTELRDTDSVAERVSWSVNMNFFEIAAKYPFGNGLGGGGTSIPYFLQSRIINPVLMENEYARIMLEQGITGLLIWIAFILWLLTRREEDPSDSWYLGRRLARTACAASFVTGLIGTGLLTSIPHTCFLLLLAGWVGARQPRTELAEAVPRYSSIDVQPQAQQYS